MVLLPTADGERNKGQKPEYGSERGAQSPVQGMRMRTSNAPKLMWQVELFLPKMGDGIGKTKVGKGTKVMMVSDGNGVPIGLYLDSAQHHEIRLAEATLKTVRVPQRRGRPRTRPKELVADRAYDSRSF